MAELSQAQRNALTMAYEAALQAGLGPDEADKVVSEWAQRTNYGSDPQAVYNLGGARRSQIPSSNVGDYFAQAVSDYNPTYSAEVFSGQEPAGRPPVGAAHRHPPGYAVDTYARDITGDRVRDRNATDEIAFNFVQNTGGNVGRGGRGYMSAGANHYDIAPLLPGMGKTWGDINPGWLMEMQQARGLNDYGMRRQSDVPTPYGPDDGTDFVRESPLDAMGINPDNPIMEAYKQMGASMAAAPQQPVGSPRMPPMPVPQPQKPLIPQLDKAETRYPPIPISLANLNTSGLNLLSNSDQFLKAILSGTGLF